MRHQIPACIRDTKIPKQFRWRVSGACGKELGIGGIHKNHSWSLDLSFGAQSFQDRSFSVGCIARRELCGGSIGFFVILATMPTCSIAIKWMKRLS